MAWHPNASSRPAIRVGDDGAPPTMICLRLERSCLVRSAWWRTALKMAGTARTRVTLWRSMAWISASGSNLRSITCWPPIMVRKCGVPQPLTWKSGTTCRATSSCVNCRPISA